MNPADIANYTNWRLQTPGGLKCLLVEGYPLFQGKPGESTAWTVKLILRAQDASAFWLELSPPPYVLGGFIIQPPLGQMPGTNGWCVAKDVKISPFPPGKPWDPLSNDPGAPSGIYAEHCQAEVTYESGPMARDRDPNDPLTFLEISIQAGGEFYSTKSVGLKYDEDGAGKVLAVQDAPGIHVAVGNIQYSMRWPFVLQPAWTTIFNTLGKVNSTVLALFRNAPIETVLFDSVSGTQKWVWDGASAMSQPWQLDFKFTQRCQTVDSKTVTWNHVFNPKAENTSSAYPGKWVKPYWISGVSTQNYMYETADFLNLFLAGI